MTSSPTPLTTFSPIERPGFVALQRILLGLLVVLHLVAPWLCCRNNLLLLDSLFPSQWTLLIVAASVGGLTWRGCFLLTAMFAFLATTWLLIYPPYLQEYAVTMMVVPLSMLAVAFVTLRLIGFRGEWNAMALSTSGPWQFSIRWLMVVTLVVAVMLAAGSWLRANAGWAAAGSAPYLIVDGVITAIICFAAVWAAGTPGAAVTKAPLLFAAATFFCLWQFYAFNMDAYWQPVAFMSVVWFAVTVGTLYIWRACGWQIVHRANQKSLREAS
ncbi:hypothetical protein [Anatilimnocola floriformis]|uniref:hypothetical protein n=1 Tax=Anatilimnocola floriformis TaxID=2948575 RepID=UPI0020C2EB61|nr:hypothetical protein [Anatilimnocola floriformis]